jgi:hypothetical protein
MGIPFRSNDLELRWLAVSAILIVTTGCGTPKLLPVSGVVTLDGKPIADAGVLFCPVDRGPPASGTTDANGQFQLATINNLGVAPGRYGVTITKKEVIGQDFGQDIAKFVLVPKQVQVKWIIPQKFSKAETSGLNAVVGPDQNEFAFSLSSH